MKNILLTLSFIILVFSLTAQTKDTTMQQQLIFKQYYYPDTKQLKEEGHEDNQGRRQGEWIFYRPDGGYQTKGYYKDDLKDGLWIPLSNKEGNPLNEGTKWIHGLRLAHLYYDVDHQHIQEELWRNDKGQNVGEYKSYFGTGDLECMGHYDKNKKIEHWAWYYPTKVQVYKTMEGKEYTGYPDGMWKSMSPLYSSWTEQQQLLPYSGKDSCMYCEGEYVKNYPEGVWTWYYPTGEKWFERTYQEGIKNGTWRGWHKNGSLYGEAEYKDGRPTGSGTFYFSGKPTTYTHLGKICERIVHFEVIDSLVVLPNEERINDRQQWLDAIWTTNDCALIKSWADSGVIVRPYYMEELSSRLINFYRTNSDEKKLKNDFLNLINYLHDTCNAKVSLSTLQYLFYAGSNDIFIPFIGANIADYFFLKSKYKWDAIFYQGEYDQQKGAKDFLDLALVNKWPMVAMVDYLLNRGVKVGQHHIEFAKGNKKFIQEQLDYYADKSIDHSDEPGTDFSKNDLKSCDKIIKMLEKELKKK